MQELIVIGGPTASGKTALAIGLAQQLNTVILSADSRQFYTEMSIGTAKPSETELAAAQHYFIASHSIHAPLSAAAYEKEALELIKTQLHAYKQLIVVGGSGMFIDALCVGLDPIPRDTATQENLQQELKEKGLSPLLEELKEKDALFYASVDRNNPMRILRALEVIRFTGMTFTSWRTKQPAERPFKVKRFVIDLPRELLYERINQRVHIMVDQGLEEEVRSLEAFRSNTALQTVGYTELFDYFDGKSTREQAIQLIQQHTRNYAKRQLTWFRRHPDTEWITETKIEEQIKQVMNRL